MTTTGGYWSTNDFAAGDGGEEVMLGWGIFPTTAMPLLRTPTHGGSRAGNVYADDDGQYGIAMRVFAPELNDTEFPVFFISSTIY